MTREEVIEAIVETVSIRSRAELARGLDKAGTASRLIQRHPKVMRRVLQSKVSSHPVSRSALASGRMNRHDWKRIVKRAKD